MHRLLQLASSGSAGKPSTSERSAATYFPNPVRNRWYCKRASLHDGGRSSGVADPWKWTVSESRHDGGGSVAGCPRCCAGC
jgi:hypothetical protein